MYRVLGAPGHVSPTALLIEVARVGFSIFSLSGEKPDAGFFAQGALANIIIGILFADEARSTITISPINPFEPKIRRLDNMGIR